MGLPNDYAPSVDSDWTAPPPPKELPPGPGIWSGLGTVALYFVLQVAVSLVLGIVLVLVYALVPGASGGLPESGQAVAQGAKAGLIIAVVTVTAVLMLWIVRYVWPRLWRVADPPGLGFAWPDNNRFFLYAVLIGVAVALGGNILTQLLAQGHPVQQDVTVMGRHVSVGMRVLLSLLVICVAPVVEELLFRGVLLAGMMRRMHAGWAIAITALIFGCVHLPDFKFAWYPIPVLVSMGVLLAWIRLRSHSLWPSITLHATNNLVAVIGWFVLAAPHG